MKKTATLLTVVYVMLATLSFGQTFTQAGDNSGFTTNCDLITETGKYEWAIWGPNCTFSGDIGGGGFDEASVGELDAGWGLGGNGYAYIIFTLTTPLDLSTAANQKIKVTLRHDDGSGGSLPLTYKLKFENAANTELLDGTTVFNTTGANEVFSYDLSDNIAGGQNLSEVKKIIFLYEGCTGTPPGSAHLYISDFSVGSLIASNNKAEELIAQSVVYPNPTSGNTTVELSAKNYSNVKIVLNDVMGNTVKVIAEEKATSLSSTFDVSDLNKGIYSVTYIVDGVPAKSEMLVVK